MSTWAAFGVKPGAGEARHLHRRVDRGDGKDRRAVGRVSDRGDRRRPIALVAGRSDDHRALAHRAPSHRFVHAGERVSTWVGAPSDIEMTRQPSLIPVDAGQDAVVVGAAAGVAQHLAREDLGVVRHAIPRQCLRILRPERGANAGVPWP